METVTSHSLAPRTWRGKASGRWVGVGWRFNGFRTKQVSEGMVRTHGDSLLRVLEDCVSCLFPRCCPYSTTSTDGELGRGLFRLRVLLLEFSFELGRRERQEFSFELGGRRRKLGEEKKRWESRRKESKSKEAAGETSGKCRGLRIWKTDRGLYLDCHDLQ